MAVTIFILVFSIFMVLVLRTRGNDPEELKKWERKNRNRRMPWE